MARRKKEVDAGIRRRRITTGFGLLTAGAIVTGLVAGVQPVEAFKPYTHIKSGEAAYQDVIDDGNVTIEGKEYPVDPVLVDALEQWRPYYNAGVIGPDGFPDLVMGQQVIHPEETGEWLEYILAQAWAAQSDRSYDSDEKGQILAFAYGFLTHAAGDVWAHTLVNEFAHETFPGVGEILTDKHAAEVALRHLITEGYIGDATEGYDGNPNRTTLDDGDVSDDETEGIPFAAPTEWVYDTLVDRNAPAPAPTRGKLIDFFYGLRDQLQTMVDTDPQPLEDAISTFEDTVELLEATFDPADCDGLDSDGDGVVDDGCSGGPTASGSSEHVSGDCTFGEGNVGADYWADLGYDAVFCPIALGSLGIQTVIDSFQAGQVLMAETIALAVDAVFDAYLAEWIEDIDEGLEHWGELGLAVTQGLFDPQTRRDAQNDECQNVGTGEGSELRGDCEDGIGMLDTVMWAADDYINDHLLSMLGLPDLIGELRHLLSEFADVLDAIVGPAMNPLREISDDVKDWAKKKLGEVLEEKYGVPVEEIDFLLDNPSARIEVQSFDLPVIGTLELFQPGDRAKLDDYLGLAQHEPGDPLGDGEFFNPDPTGFKPFANTATLARMLLLDGPTMDQLMTDLTGRPYSLYGQHGKLGNVMLTALPAAGDQTDTWLKSIDADFAWRANAQPLADGVILATNHETGGHHNFPLWESCILRPAFRTLFDDWHYPTLNASNFPDNEDPVSADPNDPAASVTSVTVGDPKFVNGQTTYVGGDATINFSATDDYWSTEEISLEISINGGPLQPYANGTTMTMSDLGLADGPVTFSVRAIDPCRVETLHDHTVVLDTTPPVVTYSQPAAEQYDTDDFSSIVYSVSDGTGSGVASDSVTFDGAPSTNGAVLDMFFLTAGIHTMVVTATDNVGNTGETPKSFRVRATSQSLRNNVTRAYQLGLITKADVYKGMTDKLNTAVKLHNQGKHASEIDMLVSVRELLQGQRGKAVDAAFADRMIGWVNDLIASHG